MWGLSPVDLHVYFHVLFLNYYLFVELRKLLSASCLVAVFVLTEEKVSGKVTEVTEIVTCCEW